MTGTCSTCGTTLHSDISRTFGQCGACRSGSERGEPTTQPPVPKPAPPADKKPA